MRKLVVLGFLFVSLASGLVAASSFVAPPAHACEGSNC